MRPRSAGRLKSSESSECSIHDEGLPELLPKIRKSTPDFNKALDNGASPRHYQTFAIACAARLKSGTFRFYHPQSVFL